MDPRSSPADHTPVDPFPPAPLPPPELQNRSHNQAPPRAANGVWQQTLQSRGAILGTLFLVTGALGLPLLWYSPVFSPFEKRLWSVVALLYTAALIGVTWAIILWCYQIIIGAF